MKESVHCFKGTIPVFFGLYIKDVTECYYYNPFSDYSSDSDMILNELSIKNTTRVTEEYYMQDGLYNREDKFGPARIIYSDGVVQGKYFYKKGILHNLLGPAKINLVIGAKNYYINGFAFADESAFKEAVNKETINKEAVNKETINKK